MHVGGMPELAVGGRLSMWWEALLAGGSSGFWAGLGLVVAGIGLTVVSALTTTILSGAAATVIFYGMMIAGIVRMVLSAPAMLGGEDRPARLDGRERSGRRPRPQPFLPPPPAIAPGLCWLSGGAAA